MQNLSYKLIDQFATELGDMQNQLAELSKAKEELEQELNQLRLLERESRVTNTSLEESLVSSNEENLRLSEALERETNERKRIEEEFRSIKASLEEQLSRREAELEQLKNLQQQFDSWVNTFLENQKQT